MKAPQTAASKGRSTRATKIDPAKEELVTKYLPLVRFVAEKIHRRLPPGVDLELVDSLRRRRTLGGAGSI